MNLDQIGLHGFETDGLTLRYRAFGKAGRIPILFLHGLLYTSYDWLAIAPGFATDRKVVALDQRGFGDSDWCSHQRYQVADFAGDVVRLVETLGWERCLLVGHSMGGRNAALAARMLGARVAGLMLLDAPPGNAATGARRIGDQLAGVPAVFPSIDAALEHFPATPWKNPFDSSRRTRFEAAMKAVPGGFALKRDPYFSKLFFRLKALWPYHSYEGASWPMGQEFDMSAALRALECPTFVVAGRAGDIFAPEAVDQILTLSRTENSNVRMISHYVHHNIPGKAPDVVIQELRNLIQLVE